MIKRYLNNLLLIFTILTVIAFSLIAYYIYSNSKQLIISRYKSYLYRETEDLASLIENQEKIVYNDVLYKLKVLNYIIYEHPFTLSNRTIKKSVIDIYTGTNNIAVLNQWLYQGQPIDLSTIQYFKIFANTSIALLQKFSDGYVVTFSDLPVFSNTTNPYYFSSTTDLANYIESKDFYIGNLTIFNRTYKIGLLPIYINTKVQGALMIILPKWYSPEFQAYFEAKTYLKSGYPFLVDTKGNIILHPTLEGANIKNTHVFYRMYIHRKPNQVVTLEYKWPETQNGKQKILFYIYLPNLNYYVGISIFKNELNKYISTLKSAFYIAVILATLFTILLLTIFQFIFINRLKKIRYRLDEIAQGRLPEEIEVSHWGIQFEIEKTLNTVIKNLKKYAEITKALSQGNYQIQFEPVSPYDSIGFNLLALKENLIQAQKEKEKHEKEEKIRTWRNEGVAKFIDILSISTTKEIEQWAFEIIKNAVDYVGGIQGGFFTLETDENDQQYFNLIACVAFDEQKIIHRKIPVTSGIFSIIYKDPKTLYISDLPESYLSITTALGQVNPKSLVVVPLIFNNNLIGAIEIYSLEELEEYKINFLEEISNHISSSLSSWKVARDTQTLLKRYQQQTQKLQEQQNILQENLKKLQNLQDKYHLLSLEYKTFKYLIDSFALRAELDVKGKVLSVNSKLASLFKKSNDFFVGKSLREFTNFDLFEEEYRKQWEQILKGKILKITEAIQIDEKQTVWLNEYYVGIPDIENNITRVLFIGLDISEQKALEKQLRAQVKEISQESRLLRKEERKLRREREQFEKEKQQIQFTLDIFNQAVGHIVLNKNQIITSVNDFIANILEYDKDQLINQFFIELLIMPDHQKFEEAWNTVLKKQKTVESFNFLTKSGNSVQLKVYFFPENDPNNVDFKVHLIIY